MLSRASLFHLRLYPVRFAGKILEHRLDLINAKPKFPEVLLGPLYISSWVEPSHSNTNFDYYVILPPCKVMSEKNIFSILLEMPTGDVWDDAELWTIYEYVRGSKKLHIPEAYRPLLLLFSTAK